MSQTIFWVTFQDCFFFFFFSIRIFFHRHWRLTGQQGKGGDHLLFHSTLPPAHEHSDIYLQLCMWDDYHIFLIAPLVFTRLLLDEIYQFTTLSNTIWLTDDVTLSFCLFTWWFDSSFFFCYSNLRLETGGFELASTITLVLQANRLTKCASHPAGLLFMILRHFRLLLMVLWWMLSLLNETNI